MRPTPRLNSAVVRLVAASLIGLCVSCLEEPRHPVVYELPAGYRGWVKIRYGVSECPDVPAGGALRFAVRPDGTACTSRGFEAGSAIDEYYAVGAATRERITPEGHIWGQVHSHVFGENGGDDFEEFFVGSKEEYRQAAEQRSRAFRQGTSR